MITETGLCLLRKTERKEVARKDEIYTELNVEFCTTLLQKYKGTYNISKKGIHYSVISVILFIHFQ